MMSISATIGIDPEEVSNKHVLFVEGETDESFDSAVLQLLFNSDSGIPTIKTLGASFSVMSVAEALYRHHPTYYFLIDRDHYHDATEIEKCWENFPDPEKHNLLIWKRKEIENYFLDIDYLLTSRYCKATKEELQKKICKLSQERLFIDVANYVVVAIREKLKKNWIQIFKNPEEFTSKEIALEKLKSTNGFNQYPTDVNNQVSVDNIIEKFNTFLDLMTGGKSKLSYEKGEWLNMIKGKQIFKKVINSDCFRVPASSGGNLSGNDLLTAVAKDLLSKDDSILPEDFIKLRELISNRIRETN